MKKLFLSLIFSSIMLFPISVFAEAQLDQGNFTVAYTEPTESIDETPLHDLDHTTIYYSLDGNTKIEVAQMPASSLTGGGNVQHTFQINGLGNQVDIDITYTATDISGNESESYTEPTIRIDSVPPKSPTGG